jgi:hypothetical protein
MEAGNTSFDKLNADAKNWARETQKALKAKLRSLDVKGTGRLIKSINYSVGKSFGVANKISYRFPKHGVFVEKGVGRGWPITRVSSSSAAIKTGRRAKPWFNPIMESEIPVLAERLKILVSEKAMSSIKIN